MLKYPSMYELMVEATFDAAHALRGYEGPCENLHGHTWKVNIFLIGENLDKTGMVMDFKAIKKLLNDILKEFDHTNLNDLAVFKEINPTSENVAAVIHAKLKEKIPALTRVTVWESPNTCASYFEQ